MSATPAASRLRRRFERSRVDPSLETTVLADDDKARLAEFFRRALELHAAGAVTADSAVDYFVMVVNALDLHTPDAIRSTMAALEDAWQEDT